MRLKATTKELFIALGNDSSIKKRIEPILPMVTGQELLIIYNEKTPPLSRKYIEETARLGNLITLDEIPAGSQIKLRNRIYQRIREIHDCRSDVRIILMTAEYGDEKMLRLKSEEVFSYMKKMGSYDGISKTGNSDKKVVRHKDGGSMYILIDYENVNSSGLSGYEYLCKDDKVVLFYSSSSSSIEKKYIDAIEEKAGSFEAVKLKAVGKNGLDFYIAVYVGRIIEKNPEAKIMIVSQDRGYSAIRDYCMHYTEYDMSIAINDDIESGIIELDGNTCRRHEICTKKGKITIDTEYKDYSKRMELKRKIYMILNGTVHEEEAARIERLVLIDVTPRERYISFLKEFGLADGVAMYRLVKNELL